MGGAYGKKPMTRKNNLHLGIFQREVLFLLFFENPVIPNTNFQKDVNPRARESTTNSVYVSRIPPFL